MAKIKIRALDEHEWQSYREARLAALKDAPEAFFTTFEEEVAYDDDVWHERMARAQRFVADRDGEDVGLVGLGPHDEDPGTGEVLGLWTDPSVRGERVAWKLVTEAAQQAAKDGHRLLYFWAGSDNAAAVGFASRFGFRPTSQRRPAPGANSPQGQGADEVAMVLPLSADPTQAPNPYME